MELKDLKRFYQIAITSGMDIAKERDTEFTKLVWDVEYHELRCMAFWMTDELRELPRADLVGMILTNSFAVMQTRDDLDEQLECLLEAHEDEINVLLVSLDEHINSYFGN